jgi:thiol-disulfide isomerase/thioredoxin
MSPEDQKYLGLDKEGPFSLKDIKADYLVVESFSTTCPHCMSQAPHLNQLFKMVEGDAQLKGKIKFLAAGQGNNENAVQMWKKFHKVPFPLVADMERALGKAINFEAFPVTLLIDKSGKALWVEVGAMENAEPAFKAIKAAVK